ncbi:MAG: WD40 repeat domain-containing protein [Chloroflexi bacterium]|nr:MAG: WD40 repeat domain-containing protein [Chloroflexota bacterium]MBL1193862.1 WD40 repeat domain-containing protein [Chloroflexota bacterium]NOH11156.1 WD40 repeat domain-containing protein [Chloroflexota bacterium]
MSQDSAAQVLETISAPTHTFVPTRTATSTLTPFPESTATPGHPAVIQLANGGCARFALIIDRQRAEGRSIATAFWSQDEGQIIYALASEADSLDLDWYAYDPQQGTSSTMQVEPPHQRSYETVYRPYPFGAVSPTGRYVLEYVDTSPPTPTPAGSGPRERRFDLWLLDTRTQERALILENQLGFPYDVQWSADGSHFLVSTGGEGTSRHYVVQRGQEPSYHLGQEGDVLLSPDGQWVAIGDPYGPIGLQIIDTESDLVHKLEVNANELSWTSDSRHIFFLSPVDYVDVGDLWKFHLESQVQELVLPGKDIEQLSFCYELTCNYTFSTSLDRALFWTTTGAWLVSLHDKNAVDECK